MFRFSGLFKPSFVKASVAASTLYLVKQVKDHRDFTRGLPVFSQSSVKPSPFNRQMVSAEIREFLILGRQSPRYAREKKKGDVLDSTNGSPSLLETGVHNEKFFELFPWSDFIVIPCTQDQSAPTIRVKPEQMVGKKVSDIEAQDQYALNFARKAAFAGETKGKLPFYHGSLALRVITEARPAKDGEVVLSGAEAQDMIARMNEICKREHCTMADSNCYTVAIAGLVFAAQIIDERLDVDTTKKAADIQSIVEVVSNVVGDNFGRGVSNNTALKHLVTVELKELTDKYTTEMDTHFNYALQP